MVSNYKTDDRRKKAFMTKVLVACTILACIGIIIIGMMLKPELGIRKVVCDGSSIKYTATGNHVDYDEVEKIVCATLKGIDEKFRHESKQLEIQLRAYEEETK